MYKIIFFILVLLYPISLPAQQVVSIEKDEQWYGAAVNEGDKMPFGEGYSANLKRVCLR